ncbi:hypothetical protein [Flexithrix dorotheae]|nr:hypothetical protein [Flexithrix dorotheae]
MTSPIQEIGLKEALTYGFEIMAFLIHIHQSSWSVEKVMNKAVLVI